MPHMIHEFGERVSKKNFCFLWTAKVSVIHFGCREIFVDFCGFMIANQDFLRRRIEMKECANFARSFCHLISPRRQFCWKACLRYD